MMRLRDVLATAAAMVVAGATLTTVSPAQADTGVDISSSGITSIKTYTYRSSQQGYVTFRIQDDFLRAQVVSECTIFPDGRRRYCESLTLRPMEFGNGDWRIRETVDGWEVRARVSWNRSSEEDCLAEYPGADEYGVELTVLGEEEEFLGSHEHYYESVCQGYVGSISGGKTLVARVGYEVRLPLRVRVIDYPKSSVTARVCFMDEYGDRFNCANLRLSRIAKSSRSGWFYKDAVVVRPQTRSQCRYLRWDRPSLDYEVTIRDRRGSTLTRFEHSFRLTCR